MQTAELKSAELRAATFSFVRDGASGTPDARNLAESIFNPSMVGAEASPLKVLDLREQSGVQDPAAALRSVTESLSRGRLPVPTTDMLQLAQEAVESLEAREGDDVFEWARRLGGEIAKP